MIDRDSARNFVVEKICFVANHGCDFSHWFSGEKKQQKHQVFAPVLSLLLGYTFYNCLISTMDFVTIESPCDEYIYICNFLFLPSWPSKSKKTKNHGHLKMDGTGR